MEVKVCVEEVKAVQKQLQFDGMFYVEGVRKGRGVAFMWREKQTARLISFSKMYIDIYPNPEPAGVVSYWILWAPGEATSVENLKDLRP